jgi:hypothetical protein
MRDRSWQLRADDRSTQGSYSYGIASARDAFLAFTLRLGAEDRVVAGFLLRDGEKADLVAGTRRVERSREGWDFAGGCFGQDQDIWSPDLLAADGLTAVR